LLELLMRVRPPAGTLAIMLAMALSHGVSAQPLPAAYAAAQQLAALPDGRKINLVCQGQGLPTVVLTAGTGDWSAAWNKVQPLVAKQTRVCAWDRPGYGFSDASSQPQTAQNLAGDLQAALKAASIGAPYVLVAHSAGSFETLLFADRNRAAVAGMVLVDPTIPDVAARVDAISPLAASLLRADLGMRATALRHCAANPVQPAAADAAICFRLPAHAQDLAAGLEARDHDAARLNTRASLFEQFEPSAHAAANTARNYGDLPLAVLTSETEPLGTLPVEQPERKAALEKLWNDDHDQLAALSRRGSNRTVPGSGHQIALEHPDAVAAAIGAVLDSIRR
jgi:pimeloyl-ACP methyl ester carboxylesterase